MKMTGIGEHMQLSWLRWSWGDDVHVKEDCDRLARSALLPWKIGWCCSMVSGCAVKCSALWFGTESRHDFHFTHDLHHTYFIALSYSDINHQRQMLITFYINKFLLKDWKDILVIKIWKSNLGNKIGKHHNYLKLYLVNKWQMYVSVTFTCFL